MLSAIRRNDRGVDIRDAKFPNYLCGSKGVYDLLIKKYFTPENVKYFFGNIKWDLPGKQRSPRWNDAAQHRGLWKIFAQEAPGT